MFESSTIFATVTKPVALIAIDDPSTHSHSPSSRLNRHMGHIIDSRIRLLLLVETSSSNSSSFRQMSARGRETSIIIPSNVDSRASFTLAHRYRRPSETEHWNMIPGFHSEGAASSFFGMSTTTCLCRKQKFDRMSVLLRSLSSLNTTAHGERETRPDAARRRDTRRETSIRRRLTSFGAKEAAGCLLSSQSKPVTRNGTVDGDSPAPALGRRFPHDRLGARVEERWSRAGPAARFEAAATVPGYHLRCENAPLWRIRGPGEIGSHLQQSNVAGTAKWRRRRRHCYGMEFLRDVLNIPQRRGGRDRPSFLSPLLLPPLSFFILTPRSSCYLALLYLFPPSLPFVSKPRILSLENDAGLTLHDAEGD